MAGLDALAGLAINTSVPKRMLIEHPTTQKPIYDKAGNPAYIDLVGHTSSDYIDAGDSDARKRARSRKVLQNIIDPIQNRAAERKKLAAATKGWHLVDPTTREPIAYAFSVQNAYELYSDERFAWLRDQAEFFCHDESNWADKKAGEEVDAPLAPAATSTTSASPADNQTTSTQTTPTA